MAAFSCPHNGTFCSFQLVDKSELATIISSSSLRDEQVNRIIGKHKLDTEHGLDFLDCLVVSGVPKVVLLETVPRTLNMRWAPTPRPHLANRSMKRFPTNKGGKSPNAPTVERGRVLLLRQWKAKPALSNS